MAVVGRRCHQGRLEWCGWSRLSQPFSTVVLEGGRTTLKVDFPRSCVLDTIPPISYTCAKNCGTLMTPEILCRTCLWALWCGIAAWPHHVMLCQTAQWAGTCTGGCTCMIFPASRTAVCAEKNIQITPNKSPDEFLGEFVSMDVKHGVAYLCTVRFFNAQAPNFQSFQDALEKCNPQQRPEGHILESLIGNFGMREYAS